MKPVQTMPLGVQRPVRSSGPMAQDRPQVWSRSVPAELLWRTGSDHVDAFRSEFLAMRESATPA
jgi:hypothetical protein